MDVWLDLILQKLDYEKLKYILIFSFKIKTYKMKKFKHPHYEIKSFQKSEILSRQENKGSKII